MKGSKFPPQTITCVYCRSGVTSVTGRERGCSLADRSGGAGWGSRGWPGSWTCRAGGSWPGGGLVGEGRKWPGRSPAGEAFLPDCGKNIERKIAALRSAFSNFWGGPVQHLGKGPKIKN